MKPKTDGQAIMAKVKITVIVEANTRQNRSYQDIILTQTNAGQTHPH